MFAFLYINRGKFSNKVLKRIWTGEVAPAACAPQIRFSRSRQKAMSNNFRIQGNSVIPWRDEISDFFGLHSIDTL